MTYRTILAWPLAAISLAAQAQAHFLFTRIGPHAEGGRQASVFFSENATAGDPKFVEKIAGTQLWAQTAPGKFQPLEVRKETDRLTAFVPSAPAVSIAGQCEYGVLTRKDVSFLLEYYPKAVVGDAKALGELKPLEKLPLEIVATFGEEGVTLTVLQDGKPVPGAQFTTVDDTLANEQLKADKDGRAAWKPSTPGYYCVYTSATIKQAGERGGKSYSEIRRFATLSLAWPLVRSEPDDEAVALFEKGIAARAAWRAFPGFAAEITGFAEGRAFRGSVRVGADGAVTTEIKDAAAKAWVDDQLGSIVLHRQASPRRNKPVLYFAEDPYVSDPSAGDGAHPLGRLVTFVGGRFASSYRVRGDEIMVVNRHLGEQNMTITVLENEKNAEGKYLPRSYTVQYWNAAKGKLESTEAIQDGWQRVENWDLPASHTVTTASAKGLTVRSFKLTGHKLPGK
jgi:hypothetical protein